MLYLYILNEASFRLSETWHSTNNILNKAARAQVVVSQFKQNKLVLFKMTAGYRLSFLPF